MLHQCTYVLYYINYYSIRNMQALLITSFASFNYRGGRLFRGRACADTPAECMCVLLAHGSVRRRRIEEETKKKEKQEEEELDERGKARSEDFSRSLVRSFARSLVRSFARSLDDKQSRSNSVPIDQDTSA